MSEWFAGPVERRIQPPMKNAITVYHRHGNVVIYITESAFLKEPPTHNTHQLVEKIVRCLNELEIAHGEENIDKDAAGS